MRIYLLTYLLTYLLNSVITVEQIIHKSVWLSGIC